MATITFEFIDGNGKNSSITVNKSEFVATCESRGIEYFVRMLQNSFAESSMHTIKVHVPYASAMVEIVRYIVSGEYSSTKPTRIIKRIYCMNFIMYDFTHEFIKLINLDILDTKTIDLTRNFIELKENENSGFTSGLYDRIFELHRDDFIVVYCSDVIIVYDNKRRVIINKIYPDKPHTVLISKVIINYVQPVVLVKYFPLRVVLYDIRSGQILIDFGAMKINSMCFSPTGNFLYLSTDLSTFVYDLVLLKKTTQYTIKKNNGTMSCSPDGKQIAYNYINYADGDDTVRFYYFATNTDISTKQKSSITDLYFIDNRTLVYHNHRKRRTSIYNFAEGHRTKTEDLERMYVEVMCHPNRNIFIEYGGIINCLEKTRSACRGTVYQGNQKIRSILVDENTVTHSQCCFSHDGNYVYATQCDNNSCNIIKYIFNYECQLVFCDVYHNICDHKRESRCYRIFNACYKNKQFVEKMGQLLNIHAFN